MRRRPFAPRTWNDNWLCQQFTAIIISVLILPYALGNEALLPLAQATLTWLWFTDFGAVALIAAAPILHLEEHLCLGVSCASPRTWTTRFLTNFGGFQLLLFLIHATLQRRRGRGFLAYDVCAYRHWLWTMIQTQLALVVLVIISSNLGPLKVHFCVFFFTKNFIIFQTQVFLLLLFNSSN